MFFISYTIVIVTIIPIAMGVRPGTYFWKPRLSIDLSIPSTKSPFGIGKGGVDVRDIYDGVVTLIDGYTAGLTIMAFAAGIAGSERYPFMNPTNPVFWTSAYRWFLRYVALLPLWVGGSGGHFTETVKLWKRRFYYMDEFIPKGLRKLLFFIKPEQWQEEYADYRKYKKYSEHAFGRFMRYPNKAFNEFKSLYSNETVDLNYDEVSSESQVLKV